MTEISTNPDGLLTIEAIQKILNRSRASVYRYANTDPVNLNPPFDPGLLNPEIRKHKDDPLLFHPNEVARFGKDVLGIKAITITVQEAPENETNRLLKRVLQELHDIRQILEER